MPEEIWEAAVELARDHGAYRIAGELGLSYQALKQRTDEADRGGGRTRESGARRRAEFVEIDLGRALARGAGEATEIEMVRGDELRLRIRLGAREPLDLAAVTAAFVGGRR